jgi:hypothetical protein
MQQQGACAIRYTNCPRHNISSFQRWSLLHAHAFFQFLKFSGRFLYFCTDHEYRHNYSQQNEASYAHYQTPFLGGQIRTSTVVTITIVRTKRYGLRGYSLMKSSSNSCSFRELFLNFAPITINAITTANSNMLPKVIRFHLLSLFLFSLFGFSDAADPCQNRQYPENNNADGNNDFDKIENSPPIRHYPEDPDTQKTKPHNDIQHDFVSPFHCFLIFIRNNFARFTGIANPTPQ